MSQFALVDGNNFPYDGSFWGSGLQPQSTQTLRWRLLSWPARYTGPHPSLTKKPEHGPGFFK
jgi:hypothetical protein